MIRAMAPEKFLPMFCSTIIATIDHPKLSAAVQSVLNQDFSEADFEVIVVNDSGRPLPDMDWQHSPRVQLLTTQQRERSVARNTGAAVAQGQYLHFLDQDDMMLPGALQAFWELAQTTDAVWLYGSYQSMDNEGNLLKEFHPDVAGDFFALSVSGEHIPLHASLLQTSAFFAAGGFDPNFTIAEDLDLGRRMALQGAVAKTPAVVARIRVGRVVAQGIGLNFLNGNAGAGRRYSDDLVCSADCSNQQGAIAMFAGDSVVCVWPR